MNALAESGSLTSENRQEFILWSDALGLSMAVDALDDTRDPAATERQLAREPSLVAAPRTCLGAVRRRLSLPAFAPADPSTGHLPPDEHRVWDPGGVDDDGLDPLFGPLGMMNGRRLQTERFRSEWFPNVAEAEAGRCSLRSDGDSGPVEGVAAGHGEGDDERFYAVFES